MKKKTKLFSTVFAGLMFFNTVSPAVVSASTFSSTKKTHNAEEQPIVEEIHNAEEQPTVEEIQSLDQFVSVENNRFVLNLPEYVEIDDATYDAVILNINTANEEIAKHNGTINPNTKTINTNEITLFSSKGYTSQKFWWGERAIYSNSQAIRAVKDVNVAAAQIGLGGLGLAVIPFLNVFAAPTGITAGYLTLLGAKMDAANNGRGVILDMTWALVYTVKSR